MDWVTTVVGIAVAELFYILVRYEYSTPQFRARVIEELWGYVLSLVVIATIAGLYAGGLLAGLSKDIANGLGIPWVEPGSGSIEGYITSTAASWAIFYAIIAALRGLGTIEVFGFRLGVLSALADFLSRVTSLQWLAYEWFVADLAILYVLTLFYEYMTKYGFWAFTASLILPRSTRSIGATFTMYYLVLAITLPIMFGLLTLELKYVQAIVLTANCNPSNGISAFTQCILSILGSLWLTVAQAR